MCQKLFMRCSILACALFIPGGALFIPTGCLIHSHPALIIPRVGLNWSPVMNRSLYLNEKLAFCDFKNLQPYFCKREDQTSECNLLYFGLAQLDIG